MKTKLSMALGLVGVLGLALMQADAQQQTAEPPDSRQDSLQAPRDTSAQRTDGTSVDRATDSATATQRTGQQARSNARKNWKASDLIGMNVRGTTGDDDIGSIDDLVIGADGRVEYAAVSFGGFLGIGDKKFAVPFQAIDFVRNEDESFARMDVTERSLEQMQGFNQDNWPEQANPQFRRGLDTRQAERPEAESPGQDPTQR